MPLQGIALVVLGFGVSAAVAAVSWRATRSGKQLLATAENPYAAELLGVNVERARLTAYAIGGLLGALAGILLIPLIAVDFQSGLAMTLRGFIAAAISGMSPVGVLFSGLGLGLFESMVGAYLGALYQDPVMFCILILRRAVAEPEDPLRRRRAGHEVRALRRRRQPSSLRSPYLGVLPGWTLSLATVTAFMALSLIGLNLIFGVTGMLALGQAAFIALPGYAAGILHKEAGVPVLLAILLGILVAVAIARLVAEVFVRLPGIYFAIGTLGFAFVVEGLARAFPAVTGGASGLVLEFPLRHDTQRLVRRRGERARPRA